MLFGNRSRSGIRHGLCHSDTTAAAATLSLQRGVAPRLTHVAALALTANELSSDTLKQLLPNAAAPLNLVLADGNYQLLLVEAPRVEPSELRAAIRWKVKDLIDFHIDDAVIDVFEIPGQAHRPSGQTMMYAVAARAREIRTHIDRVEDAGLKLEVIDISEMALRNLAALTEEDVQGVCLLHLQDDHGLLTLTRQAHLYLSRRLEIGTLDLDRDPQAAGEQIVLEVQRSLDYYDSHFQQAPLAGLNVLPGPAGLDRLVGLLDDNLNLDAAPYPLTSLIQIETEVNPAVLADAILAIGGALRREEFSL